jgi:FKBP-type peptidyl-prolyl cis-trans isomerase 2
MLEKRLSLQKFFDMQYPAQASMGDRVEVHYTGRLVNGETFDSSRGHEPLEFILGAGQVIRGFEDAVMHMREGDQKTVDIPSELAYGPYHKHLLMPYPRNRFPREIDPVSGMNLQVQNERGEPLPVTVLEIKGEEVILDANHPLAGRDLIFDLELVRIFKDAAKIQR